MATRRTQIEIVVIGLQDLQAANSALNTHVRAVQRLAGAYQALNATTGQLSGGLVTVNNNFNTTNNAVTNLRNNLGNANNAGQNFLGTMLRYKAVGLVFEGISAAVKITVDAMKDMEKQAARVQRIAPSGSTPLIRSTIAVEAARTGASVEQIGEALYQIAPFIKETNAQFAALQGTMNLVVGTEIDAREAARTVIQIYNQFGDQLGDSVSQTEKMSRITNTLAFALKNTNTEVGEVSASLKYFGSIAAAIKLPVDQVFALIGALDKAGVRSTSAGTALRAFVTNLLTKYKADLGDGQGGGIEYKGHNYHFDFPIDAKGQSDAIGAIKSINEKMDYYRNIGTPDAIRKAQQFMVAVSGRVQSMQVTAILTGLKDLIKDMETAQQGYNRTLHTTTTEADDLRKTMTTTAQEFERVWKGSLNNIISLIDMSGLRTVFHGWADDIQRASEAIRLVRLGQGSLQEYFAQSLSGHGEVRTQVQDTRRTVEAALANLMGSHEFPGVLTAHPNRQLEDATKGMTQAQVDMIRHRYLRGNLPDDPGAGVLDQAAMERDLVIMSRQLNNPRFGVGGAPAIASPFTGGRRAPGFDPVTETEKEREKKEREAQRAADEADRARSKALDNAAKRAQNEFDFYKLHHGADDPETMRLGRLADTAAASAADEIERQRYRYGLTGNVPSTQKDALAERKQRLEDAEKDADTAKEKADKALQALADKAKTDVDLALRSGGLFSLGTAEATARAQRLALSTEDDENKRRRIQQGLEGPMYEQKQRIKEYLEGGGSFGFGIPSVPSAAGLQADYVSRMIQKGELGIRALQRGGRPNDIFTDQDQSQRGILQNTVSTIATIVKALEAIPNKSERTNQELETMRERLADANASLIDFNDRLQAQAYQRRIKSEQDAYELRAEDITHMHRLRFAKDDEGAYANKVQELGQLLQNAQGYVEIVRGDKNLNPEHFDRLQQAAKQRDAAQQNLSDYVIDAKIQRYLNVYQNVKGTVHDEISAFLHGQGDLGTVAQGLGGTIVQASFDQFIKKYTDPLVSTITGEILAIQGNTDALGILTSTMTGGGGLGGGASSSPFAASVAAGVQQGMQDFGWGPVGDGTAPKSSKKPGQPKGLSDLQKGVSSGLAAYSIGATSAQQGVNFGNLLGAGLTGFSLGGPLGAGIGVAVDLIGGLFHHKSKPTETPQNLNPALYNAPSGFDLGAYNYSAYGKLPTLQNVGFDVKPTNVPTINVYVDGAKVAAQQEISRQASSVSVSLSNVTRDRYRPI